MSDATDQELFENITSSAPHQAEPAPEPVAEAPAPAVEAAPEPAQPAPVRDERGRFTVATEPQQPTAEPAPNQPQAEREPAIPPSRLREEAEARRQAEARAVALETELRLMRQQNQPQPQQPTAPPDLFESPDAWASHQINPVRDEVRQTREFYSRKFAEMQHGADKVKEAYQALDAAVRTGEVNRQQVMAQLERSPDPYAEIMAWHGRRSILSEVGDDPNAYRQKIIDGFLADPANHAKLREVVGVQTPAPAQAAPAAQSTVRLPPNLNRMTSAAPTAAPGAQAEVGDQELFESITSRRR